MHLLSYAWFDMEFDVAGIAADVVKRPFILVGFLAWLLLLALAATSFNRAIRAMGAQRWQWLHRAVYAVACLAVLHFFWMRSGKNDFAEVGVYAVLLALLLGWRVWERWRPRGQLGR
ncbi:Sulfoxide reductase heme-binding subunit YedZ [compost metagenome]